ncbi:MAG: aminotransferase DegT [Lentisphaerae bacterium GWF2_45_14]|nr:MAG: aminotransferase DegT [Lentisphaerae bacterium GWF2_45_14]
MYKIPLIKPYLPKGTREKVLEVLDSGYLTEGPVTAEFENIIENFIGCGHVLAVTSCTTGLELALRALGIGPGNEVITADYTYPATADVIRIVGADAVIVDVSKDTMLIDYDAMEKAITPKTKAIIPVSIFGNPLDYDRLDRIREKYNLKIIEDAACALGAEYKGAKAGTQADIAVFSLHPRKFLTAGEGGLVTTNNCEWAAWMNSYKHFGMGSATTRENTGFQMIGTNYKFSNILAAVAIEQARQIDLLLERRRTLASNYIDMLGGKSGVTLPSVTEGGLHSYQTFSIFIEERDRVMKSMREMGIEVQIGTYSLHMHKAFQQPGVRLAGNFENSRYAFEHCLAIPLFHEMELEQQKTVVRELLKLL